MPWKNGGGTTSEVAIFPTDAEVGLLNFDWRVSIAAIETDGPFSSFPGYDRHLVVWRGDSAKLNDDIVANYKVFEFKGELAVTAKLMGGPVQDFGVIFKRDKIVGSTTTHLLNDDAVQDVAAKGETFLMCMAGELRVGEFYLNPGDVIHASGEGSLIVTALETSRFVTCLLSPRVSL